MKVTYVGPYEGVDVSLPDGSAIYAERDKPIDLRPELAKGLLIQEDIWIGPQATTPPAPSKSAQKAAAELGVDLDQVEGTGSNGAIKVDDVKAAAEAIKAAQTGAQPPADNNSADGATTEGE